MTIFVDILKFKYINIFMRIKQKSFVLWMTGFSASGKTTLAKCVCRHFEQKGLKFFHLDGDEIRAFSGGKSDFSREGREKNIRFAVDLAKKYQKDNYIIVASFISPYREHREQARRELENFVEVFVNSPLEVCENRDPKGLYKKARRGEINFFTGLDDPYEPPDRPEIELRTDRMSVRECADFICYYLSEKGFVDFFAGQCISS